MRTLRPLLCLCTLALTTASSFIHEHRHFLERLLAPSRDNRPLLGDLPSRPRLHRPKGRAFHRPARPAARLAARRLLQGDCDINMTLVDSGCVCAAGWYDSASAPQLDINGVDSVCLGTDPAQDYANECSLFVDPLGTPGVCGVSAGASDGYAAYTAVDPTLNGGPRILPPSPGAAAWLQVDMETTRLIGGVSFRQWLACPDGSSCAGAFTGLQIWVGNNPSAWNAAGNTKCFQSVDPTAFAPLNSGATFSAQCVAAGRYLYLVAPDNAGGFTGMPIWHLQAFAPLSCNPITPCVACPDGYVSEVGALTVGDCYVATGVQVNNTIHYVDVGLNQSEFLAALPDYLQVISYSEDPEAFAENCPAGYYCLSDTTIPKACPAGTYRDAPGAESVGDCFPCPPGDYCPIASPYITSCPAGTYRGEQGARSAQECTPCPAGNYCPMGAVEPTNCTAGTYRATSGATVIDDCLACPSGHYCGGATAAPTDCPAGTFYDNTGAVQAADCPACTPGNYCPAGSSTPTACPAGTYRTAYGAQLQAACATCPAGSFCPEGSVTPTQCAAGTFLGAAAGQSQGDCSACPAGSYCPAGAVAPIQCPAGTYLGTGSGTQLAECLPCTEGYYCLAGATEPAQCPAGTYRDIAGAAAVGECYTCPSGQWCAVASVSPTSCLPGTYRATTGATHIQDCLACPAGNYCPFATTTPMHCPAGTFLTDTGGVDRSSCVTCPSGSYCVEESTVAVACPAGSYRTSAGAGALEDCVACPAGQYCPLGTTTPTSCPAGTYRATTGATSLASCAACPVGQYCLLRTVTPTDCNGGSYRGTTGATQQADCTVCPTGNYCPAGSVDPTNCTAGTYRITTGASAPADCVVCPAGDYCPLANTNPLPCQAGTFDGATGGTAQSDCTTCPVGAYCPAGSVRPVLCGPGRHRDLPGATHLANCLLCLPGTYSLDVGRSSNCPICPANFYCRTSTLKQACPTHTTAPAGSYSILKCICNPGFSCTYYKQIQAIVTLNATLSDFNNNVNGIKTNFLMAMGIAANVSSSQVVINGVIDTARAPARRLLADPGHPFPDRFHPYAELDDLLTADWDASPVDELAQGSAPQGRRLLTAEPLPGAQPGIHVFTSVRGSGRLHRLEHHLERLSPGLHIAHRWEQAHKVHAAAHAR